MLTAVEYQCCNISSYSCCAVPLYYSCCGGCSCLYYSSSVYGWSFGWDYAVLLHQQAPITQFQARAILLPTTAGGIICQSNAADSSRVRGGDWTEREQGLWTNWNESKLSLSVMQHFCCYCINTCANKSFQMQTSTWNPNKMVEILLLYHPSNYFCHAFLQPWCGAC